MAGRWAGLVAAMALSACVMPDLPFGKQTDAAPNPVTGAEIEVTELDAPKPAEKPPAEKPAADRPPTPPPSEAAVPAPAPDAPKPRPRPAEPEAPAAEPEVAAAEPVVAKPEAEKSAGQLSCEKRKGTWAQANEGAQACVLTTRDGGQSCTKGTDCEGDCLARSKTCAPFAPLFGCNDILDDTGRRMTLCLD